MNKYENSVGVLIPEILLPKEGTDMTKWAVVACDQFTSQPDYWQETESIVGDAPSTLRLMLPEMYLEKPDEAERIEKINATMKSYLDTGVLENIGRGIMYVERRAGANVRRRERRSTRPSPAGRRFTAMPTPYSTRSTGSMLPTSPR